MKWGKKPRDSLQGWRELMRQRNNYQNSINVVSFLVCDYLTFLPKANEGEIISNVYVIYKYLDRHYSNITI